MRDNKIKLLVVILISILLVTLAINNYGIWTDEAYTLYMINNPISQILQKENSLDGTVLYMLLLKLFVEIFNGNNIKTTIFLSRLFSIIPYICLIIFGSIYIENIYSKNHGFMFIISIFTSNLISYSFEIRSYSWTILFSTLAFVSFLAINKRNNSKDWI